MRRKLPIRKLVKLNLWLSINTVLFFFVLGLLNMGFENIDKALTNLLFGFYNFICISFGNLGLFIIFNRMQNKTQSFLRIRFLTLSFSLSELTIFSTPLIYMALYQDVEKMSLLTGLLLSVMGIMMNLFVLMLQHYVIIQDEKFHTEMEVSKLKAVNFETANQLLKQQIQPHFLFNALNILKSLYKTNVNEGEKYLMHLSNFLRASLSNNNIKVIKVSEEIKLCENYIDMQKIRFGDALQFSIQLSEETLSRKYIPSFSIQPLIENAIKHNELTDEQPLIITIEQIDDWIKVSNTLRLKSRSPESTGVGLSNLSERYQLLSGDELKIEEDEQTFSISIKLLNHKIIDTTNN